MYWVELRIDGRSKRQILDLLVACKHCQQKCANIECRAAPPTEGNRFSVVIWSTCENDAAEIDCDVQGDGFKAAVDEWNRFHSDPSATYWKDSAGK